MRIREGEVQAIAAAVVKSLLKQGFVHPKGDAAAIQRRIVALIVQNLEEEEDLEREAERLAQAHARQMLGMDQRKIIQGIKERLARERGFSL
jgi:hypothetical protein